MRTVKKILFFVLLTPGMLFPQIKTSVPITCSVIIPLSILSQKSLDFGTDIKPGITTPVEKYSSNSGKFGIYGKAGKQLALFFELPGSLKSGTKTMPVVFSDTDGGLSAGNKDDVKKTFNPHSTINIVLPEESIFVYLGGKIEPENNQPMGVYSGNITFHIQYTSE